MIGKNIDKISWVLDRETKETHVVIEYEHVGESRPGGRGIIITMRVKGDFAHHAVEDAMIGLNELAEAKGIGHRMIVEGISQK